MNTIRTLSKSILVPRPLRARDHSAGVGLAGRDTRHDRFRLHGLPRRLLRGALSAAVAAAVPAGVRIPVNLL